ncbi:MAG: ATP-binding cassette domain-containing protein [Bacteroidetes bacterium]|jgi:ABC-2 type transport system ATP-binding protein|nr:ATP-binding cassette domain-containing protein [Bacteroidota bacterium]
MNQIHTTAGAIEVKGLSRYFGNTRAVDGIDLSIAKGDVFGILGPNGAGKTTLIRMLATLLQPTAGTAKVLGHDIIKEPDAVRSRVSLTGQFASIDDDLTGLENLILQARLLGYTIKMAKKRAKELLDGFGLTDAARRQAKTYSGGMRRRLDIAASIVVRPDLIFLDEPTTGLDPRSRNQVWDIVRSLVADGTTVLLTTQYLDEADQLAKRIAVIDHGKLIAEGTPGELKSSVGGSVLRIRFRDPDQRVTAKQMIWDILQVEAHSDSDPFQLSVQAENVNQASGVITQLSEAGIEITNFSLGQPSLDEVFLALTGKPVMDEKSLENSKS